MKMKTCLWALFICVGLASCGISAVKYNNELVSKEMSIMQDVMKTEAAAADFIKDKKYDSLAVAGKRMEDIVDQKIDEIKKLSPPKAKGAEEFKQAYLDYFDFFKKVYAQYKNMGLAKTDEAREEERKKLLEIVGERDNLIRKTKAVQQKFASDNGFKIQG